MAPIAPNPAKTLLRSEIANRIAALSKEEKQRQSKVVYEKILNHPWYKNSKRISLYMSTEDEINTAPIIDHIKARGAAAFVPQYAGGIMRMLKLETDDEKTMPKTRHGIQQHAKDTAREEALESGGLDLIIAPGVAFSKSGARLGHGGGYYDKFITNLRKDPQTAPKRIWLGVDTVAFIDRRPPLRGSKSRNYVIAVAFSVQMTDDVPMDEQDQKVDDVISGE